MPNQLPTTKLVKPKTKKGKRVLLKREPKAVEDVKNALLLFGGKTSQVVKDCLTDLHKLKAGESIKFTRKNADVRPFEAGGEGSLEFWAKNNDCSLFALGSHIKKRPHNLTLGRLYDYRLYDMVELGIESFKPIKSFGGAAATVQVGNKPCFVFVGDAFESSLQMMLVKSMLLDFFRGRQVDAINLKGLDHVILVTAADKNILLRHYSIKFKKSGTKVPRVELTEMGPSIDFVLRRTRDAPEDLHAEASRKAKTTKKKEKNVSMDELDGKVGRIYMPKQDLESIALKKMKGSKRPREGAATDEAPPKPKAAKS